MYNTKFICTYNNPLEVFLDTDNITNKEKELICDIIYRQELLNILGIEEYNIKTIDKALNDIYNKIKTNNDFCECMQKLAQKFMSNDDEFGLMIMFSFDYMDLTHICISEFLEKGQINKENMHKLKLSIFN